MSDGKNASIYDVADLAGVSPATVSRVANRRDGVSTATVEKVLRAMEELGFERKGRASAAGNQGIILVNLPLSVNPFYDDILASIRKSAARKGLTMLLMCGLFSTERWRECEPLLRTANVRGVISLTRVDASVIERAAKIVPVVQCCDCNDAADVPSVTIDDCAAAVKAVEHLISQGCSRIAFLNGPAGYKYAEERLRGYRLALERHGLEVPDELVISAEVGFSTGFAAATQLLSRAQMPDGVFTSSDVFAGAVVRVAHQSGIEIPGRLKIVGFDNLDLASIMVPSITSINQPREQLGLVAFDLLAEKINNPAAPTRHVVLETELIMRESTLP